MKKSGSASRPGRRHQFESEGSGAGAHSTETNRRQSRRRGLKPGSALGNQGNQSGNRLPCLRELYWREDAIVWLPLRYVSLNDGKWWCRHEPHP